MALPPYSFSQFGRTISQDNLKSFVVLLLILATIFFFNSIGRYEVIEEGLITDPLFQDAGKNWFYSDKNITFNASPENTIKLTSDSNDGYTYFYQRIKKKDDFKKLRFSIDAKTKKVTKGDESWKSARAVLIMYDKSGKAMYGFPHTLMEEYGDTDWQHYKRVFKLNEEAEEVMIAFQLMNASGEMWVKNIVLESVEEKRSFIAFKLCFILIWIIVGLWVAIPLVNNMAHSPLGKAALFIALCIITAVILPESIMRSVDRNIAYSLEEKKSANNRREMSFSVFSLYKAGHFFMFFIVGFVLYIINNNKLTTIKLLFYIMLFALATEVFQLFIDGRDAHLNDFIIDIAGVAAAFIFGGAYLSMKIYIKKE